LFLQSQYTTAKELIDSSFNLYALYSCCKTKPAPIRTRNLDQARSLGADHIIIYTKEDIIDSEYE
jgi:hypothetical protein